MSTAFAPADDRLPGDPAVELAATMDTINHLGANGSDRELIDQITMLERMKSACAAAQARLTHAVTLSQQADGAARKMHPDRTRRSVSAQIALARRDSRYRGQQHVGVAHALVVDMPNTLAALRRGDISEFRARTIIEQLACLTPSDRTKADTIIAAELPELGDRTAESRAASIAYRLDPEAVMAKVRGAVKDRHVSVRPAPDTMSRLSALLPVAHGVAVYAALSKSADSCRATGDDRSRGQIMADELVSRVTGQAITGCDSYGVPDMVGGPASAVPDGSVGSGECPKAASEGPGDRTNDNAALIDDPATTDDAPGDDDSALGHIETDSADVDDIEANINARGNSKPCRRCAGLQLNLIMTDRTLFGDDEPAHLVGHGPIPAALARALVVGHADSETTAWVRRLYTDPTDRQLVAMDSRRRLFPAGAQRFLIARDQTCRTPWCDAPIRHLDHVIPFGNGGPTHINNGQGLCEACNLTKQAPDWRSRWASDGAIHTTTPTGQSYRSRPPPVPTSSPLAGYLDSRNPFVLHRSRRCVNRRRVNRRCVSYHRMRPGVRAGCCLQPGRSGTTPRA